MPTPTYVPLATVTLGTATSTVSFSAIPSTYRDLIISVQGKAATASSYFRMRFNGDTSNSVSHVNMMGQEGNTANSNSNTGSNAVDVDFFGNLLTTADNIHQIQIMDYSATDKHKTTLIRQKFHGATATDIRVAALAARWADTSAITSISIFLNSGNIAAGSTFSLYGVIA